MFFPLNGDNLNPFCNFEGTDAAMPPHLEITARQCRAFRQEILRRKISLRDCFFNTMQLTLVQAQVSHMVLKNAVNCNFSSQKFANAHFFS